VISAPTLVLHQRADPWVRAEHGRYLAGHIPGAAFAELDGDGHIPTAAAARQILARTIEFLQEAATREAPEPDKVLATILFSDIVGSTARAAELGDARWRLPPDPSIMHGSGGSWPGSVAWSSALPRTGSLPGSTGRPGRSAVRWRSATHCAISAWRCAWACIPASARRWTARWPASPSRSARGCPRWPRRARCWYRRPPRTWWQGRGLPSKTAACNSRVWRRGWPCGATGWPGSSCY
jgi:hypothetical protein